MTTPPPDGKGGRRVEKLNMHVTTPYRDPCARVFFPHLVFALARAQNTSNSTTLVLIKRGPTLDPITPLATQLHLLNLFGSDETPYESLHAAVSNGVKPRFDAFVGVGARGQGKDGDNKMGEFVCSGWPMPRTRGVIAVAGVPGTDA